MNSKTSNHDSGQSLVLIALLMVGMIAFLGLVIDGGQIYGVRRNAQDSADAAAFAAVRKLALRADNSYATAITISNTLYSFASENSSSRPNNVVGYFIDQSGNNICKIPCPGVGVPTSPLATGVRITVTIQYEPSFINLVIGNQLIPMPAVAAAQSGNPTAPSDLKPMAVKFPCQYNPNSPTQSCSFTYDQLVQLFGDGLGPGGFQWVDFRQYDSKGNKCSIDEYLRLQCGSGPVLADPKDTYYNPSNPTQYNWPANPPSPNPWVGSGTGIANSNAVVDALDCWINPVGTAKKPCWQNYDPNTKYPGNTNWSVPVFDVNNTLSGNNLQYHTVSFGEFKFQGYWFAENQCNSLDMSGPYNCKQNPPPKLASCEQTPGDWKTMQKCLVGSFVRFTDNTQTTIGPCNTNGLDICGIGLSQ